MTRPKTEKPQTRNVNVGHLRQSLLAMRKRIDDESKQINRFIEVLNYLEERGVFKVDETGMNKTEAYFRKWVKTLENKKPPIKSYADFEGYVSKVGEAMILEQVERWVGRRVAYAEIDDLAREVLGTTDQPGRTG
jgi:hypothetical protein